MFAYIDLIAAHEIYFSLQLICLIKGRISAVRFFIYEP